MFQKYFVLSLVLILVANSANAQWNLINNQNGQYVLCVINKDSLVTATHGNGKIYYSMDGGGFWPVYQTSFEFCLFQDVFFLTDQIGYACGGSYFGMYSDVVLKTIDGGQTWNSLTFDSPGGSAFLDIFFIDENIGFVTGDGGAFLKTIDGGSNFSPVSFPISLVNFTDVFFPTDNTGYTSIADRSTTNSVYRIYKTTDQGVNWAEVYSGNKGIHEIWFLDENIGFGVGNDGLFIKTTDGGNTWHTSVIPPYTNLTSVCFTSPTTGYINNAGGIYKTVDGGVTWTVQNIFPLDIINEIRFANDTIGYALGRGGIYKTTNGGGLDVEDPKQTSLVIYPNPAKGKLHIQTGKNNEILSGCIFNNLGQEVKTFSESKTIDVSGLSPGIYFLGLKTTTGEYYEKIVVE